MTLAAKSIDRGIASATMNPPRRFPSITSKTSITRMPPAVRLCRTVLSVWSIRCVRS